MDNQHNLNSYRWYAPFYDFLFGPFFNEGRQAAIQGLSLEKGDHVLEIGAGTGASLGLYPDDCTVDAIDLSPHMLAKAQEKIHQQKHITLHEMDAMDLQFPDNHFDKVSAMYIASVVPNLTTLLNEMKRVCKPGGTMVILNHFSNEKGLMRWFEKSLQPLSVYLGWEPYFPPDLIINNPEITVVREQSVNLFGYWKLFHLINDKADICNTEELVQQKK